MASTLVDDPRDRAFERLYRRYARDVYRFALGLLRNPAEAEDVTQTTFLNAYRALQAGEEPQRPRSWLLTICHNAARSRVRAAMRRPREVPLEAAAGGLAAQEEAQTDVRELVRALGQLPSNQRSAITMRELEGRSYPEIAQALGVTVPAVDALLARARRSLRLHTAAIRGLTVAGLPRSLRKLFEHGETAAAGALGAGVAIKVGAMVAAGVAAGGLGSASAADSPAAAPAPAAAQLHVARIAAPARVEGHRRLRVEAPADARRLRPGAAPAATATAAASKAVSAAPPAAPPNDTTSRSAPPPSSQPSAPADAAAPTPSPTAPAAVVQQAAPVVDAAAGAAASLPRPSDEDVLPAATADPPVTVPPPTVPPPPAPPPPVLPPPPALPPAPLPSLGP
jgi:RNA polymerase sigma factor (sigma-70 family)